MFRGGIALREAGFLTRRERAGVAQRVALERGGGGDAEEMVGVRGTMRAGAGVMAEAGGRSRTRGDERGAVRGAVRGAAAGGGVRG